MRQFVFKIFFFRRGSFRNRIMDGNEPLFFIENYLKFILLFNRICRQISVNNFHDQLTVVQRANSFLREFEFVR